ncbi:hypothetical protein Fmac_009581 [Flemingia macrophylla]|uniref:Pectinesterase inhibitor domain-containing protein n=1 Tax=Flemingia macrophylla TaxID=520843 RepID=A0ABD1N188_9FABA
MRRIPTLVSSFTLQAILLAFLTLSQPSLPWKEGNGDLTDQICKKTPFYDLCSSILHSNPLSPKPDLKGVALLMVNNILANASDTLSYIEGLIKNTSDRDLEQALAFCAESYIPLVKYILPQAADAISQGRFGFAGYCISDVLKEINSDEVTRNYLEPLRPIRDRNNIVEVVGTYDKTNMKDDHRK